MYVMSENVHLQPRLGHFPVTFQLPEAQVCLESPSDYLLYATVPFVHVHTAPTSYWENTRTPARVTWTEETVVSNVLRGKAINLGVLEKPRWQKTRYYQEPSRHHNKRMGLTRYQHQIYEHSSSNSNAVVTIETKSQRVEGPPTIDKPQEFDKSSAIVSVSHSYLLRVVVGCPAVHCTSISIP